MRPIAIVSDTTCEIIYVLQGYNHKFGAKNEVVEINEYGKNFTNLRDFSTIEVKHGGFAHVFSSERYSVIYEEDGE